MEQKYQVGDSVIILTSDVWFHGRMGKILEADLPSPTAVIDDVYYYVSVEFGGLNVRETLFLGQDELCQEK